jgi:hypothetical protein
LHSSDDSPARLARLEAWRKRLAEAEQQHNDAAARLEAHAGDPALGEELRARKAAARAEYQRILRIFTNLVLRGKEPPEDH